MSRRLILAALLVVLVAVPAIAGPRPGPHQVSFNLGYFTPRGEDGRAKTTGDVLIADLGYYDFRVADLNNASFGGDYLFSLGDFFEVGAGVSYYSGTAPSVDAYWSYPDQSPIVQELKLRMVPITATVRFLPLSRNAPVQPYIGGGVAILPWNYSETGDFSDTSTDPPEIFHAQYYDSGTEAGLLLVGGIRLRVSPRYGIGGEIRWQKAASKIGTGCSDSNSHACFYGDKIDLGGFTYNFTFSARF
jgi:hypothetical protein